MARLFEARGKGGRLIRDAFGKTTTRSSVRLEPAAAPFESTDDSENGDDAQTIKAYSTTRFQRGGWFSRRRSAAAGFSIPQRFRGGVNDGAIGAVIGHEHGAMDSTIRERSRTQGRCGLVDGLKTRE